MHIHITFSASALCIVLAVSLAAAVKVCRRLHSSLKAARGRRRSMSVHAAARSKNRYSAGNCTSMDVSSVVAGPLDQASALAPTPGASVADIFLLKAQRMTVPLAAAASTVASPGVKIHQTPWWASEGDVRGADGEVSSDDSHATVQIARTRRLAHGATAQDHEATAVSLAADSAVLEANVAGACERPGLVWLETELQRSRSDSPPSRRPASRGLVVSRMSNSEATAVDEALSAMLVI